jgi:hypothetical protein
MTPATLHSDTLLPGSEPTVPPHAGEFTWCLHCRRVFPAPAWTSLEGRCPRAECNGHTLDTRRWEDIRRVNPDYPPVPREGGRYPALR